MAGGADRSSVAERNPENVVAAGSRLLPDEFIGDILAGSCETGNGNALAPPECLPLSLSLCSRVDISSTGFQPIDSPRQTSQDFVFSRDFGLDQHERRQRVCLPFTVTSLRQHSFFHIPPPFVEEISYVYEQSVYTLGGICFAGRPARRCRIVTFETLENLSKIQSHLVWSTISTEQPRNWKRNNGKERRLDAIVSMPSIKREGSFFPRPRLILGFYKERHAHFPRVHGKSTIVLFFEEEEEEKGRMIKSNDTSAPRRVAGAAFSRGTRSPSERRSLPYNFTVKPFLLLDPDELKSLVFGVTAVYPKCLFSGERARAVGRSPLSGLMHQPRNEANARSEANAQT
ncbi:hypothetical protein HZH66_009624 [Vespula vulgaris]|uniref:Uncharacterized protein n=1 Tax=Vespula vulgaris TaxID=7454 RepID=A0A834N134_VESVU|nr:hypothetical protein HZH66_009624 [Vespula vulgaris]